MSVIVTICSKCGKEDRRQFTPWRKMEAAPDGWKHYDFNVLGPDPDNEFDLCPHCVTEWKGDQLSAMEKFCKKDLQSK